MRLLILTTQDRFFLTHVSERAIFFKKKGWQVYVAAQLTSEKYKEQIEDLGFQFYDTRIERKAINPVALMTSFLHVLDIYKKVSPDLCFHLGAKAIFIGTAACKCFSKGKIGIINAPIGLGFIYSSNSIKARVLRPIVDFMYKLTLNPKNSKVIIENHDDLKYFVSNGAVKQEQIFCIPGAGVCTSVFRPEKKYNTVTVVMAARLIEEKGVWDYIQVADKLREQGVPVRMQLVGTPDFGNPTSITEVELECIKNNPSIEYLGYQENMQNIFNRAHICCLPSYREGLPRVLVEAASSGMALITTDTVGCRETVNGKNGILVPIHGVSEIVDQIKDYVFHSQKLCQAQNESRLLALDKFDTKIICQQTYQVAKLLCQEE